MPAHRRRRWIEILAVGQDSFDAARGGERGDHHSAVDPYGGQGLVVLVVNDAHPTRAACHAEVVLSLRMDRGDAEALARRILESGNVH